MNKYYISCFSGKSGIAHYSRDFYNLILKDKGYQHIDSSRPLSSILSMISSRDIVHIEIGIFLKREQEILFSMIRGNYKQLSVTLHDAPILKYPFREYKQGWLNKLSKIVDRVGGRNQEIRKYLEKLKSIYVLTHLGEQTLKHKFQLTNVRFLPHIINPDDLSLPESGSRHLSYFGFIGRNKGLEYALQLHQLLLKDYSDVHMNVIGMALGKETVYLEKLKLKFADNVKFRGYVSENEVAALFSESCCTILPFKNYRFFFPVSGSILYSLKKGNIVFTSKVNAVPEIISDGINGLFLTGKIQKDLDLLKSVVSDDSKRQRLVQNGLQYLQNNHFPAIVKKHYID